MVAVEVVTDADGAHVQCLTAEPHGDMSGGDNGLCATLAEYFIGRDFVVAGYYREDPL